MLALPLSLLAACGDSLEDRNAAVGADRQPEMTIQSQAERSSTQAARRPTSAQPTSQGFADEDQEEVLEVEADDASFVDSAQGFSTDPIDDTSGFDPSPPDFAAEEG